MSAPSISPTVAPSSDAIGSFISLLITNVAIGSIMIILFSFLRTKTEWCHHFRLYDSQSLMAKVPAIPSTLFGWIKVTWSMTDDDLINSEIGVDAYMYLRFLSLSFRYFLSISPIAIFYIFLYKFADPQDDVELNNMDQLTLANVNPGSNLLFVYCLGSFFLTGFLLFMMYHEYKTFVHIRHQYYLKDKSSPLVTRARRTALVQKVPKTGQQDGELLKLFRSLYGDSVESATMCFDTRNIDKLISDREAIYRKLERAEYDLQKSDSKQRPTIRSFPLFGKRIDAIEYFSGKIQHLNKQISEMQKSGFKTTSNGFVTFKTYDAISTSLQTAQTMDPFAYECKGAMQPGEVLWENLVISPFEKKVRGVVGSTMVFCLVVFWTIPVAFASSLSNLENLESFIPGLSWLLDELPALANFLAGFLPGLALTIFKAILPIILMAISKLKGFEALPWAERETFTSFFYFQLFNFYLVAAIGGAFIASAQNIADDPASAIDMLARELPSQWLLFLSYITLQTFASFPMLLVDIGGYIVGSLKLKYFARTDFEIKEAVTPTPMKYHVDYPNQLLIFMVGCAFAPLAPILVPFIVIYFGMALIVYRYRLVYNIPKCYDGGGSLFPLVFNRVIVGVIVGQLTLLGVLGLKEFPYAIPFMLIQVILTIVFRNAVNAAFLDFSDNLCREEMVKLDKTKVVESQIFVDRSMYLPSSTIEPQGHIYQGVEVNTDDSYDQDENC